MSTKSNKALREALDKFVHIGDCFYNGKHHDNVLNIFNDMEHEDRLTLLRGVHDIYSILENGSFSAVVGRALAPPSKQDDEKTLTSVNEIGMQELKFWFVKVIFLAIMVGLLLLVGFVFVLSLSGDESKSISLTMKAISLLLK